MATSPITKPLQNIETKHIRIIGVPLDLGQSRRGVDMGPSAMRVAGLEAKLEALGYDVEDGGNVPVAMLETETEGDPNAKYLNEITETCSKQAELVIKTLESRADPADPGRRSLHRRGNRLRRGRVLSPQKSAHRPAVDRRPQRHQHARQFAQRQRSRHAARRHHGPVPLAAHRHVRLQPQGAPGKLRPGGHSRRRSA